MCFVLNWIPASKGMTGGVKQNTFHLKRWEVFCIQVNEFLSNVPNVIDDREGTHDGGSNSSVGELIAKLLVLLKWSLWLHYLIFHVFVFAHFELFWYEEGFFIF